MTYSQIIEELIPDPKIRGKFHEWAFGVNYQDLYHTFDIMERWNILHKDTLELKPAGHVYTDITKMVELWKDTLHKDK